MKEYVAGFAFRNNYENVLLLLKAHPSWQAGFFNGVGGKVKAGEETPREAMMREFREEVGAYIAVTEWIHFCTIYGCRAAWRVTFFKTHDIASYTARRMEDEEPIWIPTHNLPENIINNLTWLIPMAKAQSPVIANVQEIVR